jgi:hypothetical protein
MEKLILKTSYTVQREYVVELPDGTTLENLKSGKIPLPDNAIEIEDSYFETTEEPIALYKSLDILKEDMKK